VPFIVSDHRLGADADVGLPAMTFVTPSCAPDSGRRHWGRWIVVVVRKGSDRVGDSLAARAMNAGWSRGDICRWVRHRVLHRDGPALLANALHGRTSRRAHQRCEKLHRIRTTSRGLGHGKHRLRRTGQSLTAQFLRGVYSRRRRDAVHICHDDLVTSPSTGIAGGHSSSAVTNNATKENRNGKIVVSQNINARRSRPDPTGEEGFRHGGWLDRDREGWAKVGFDEAPRCRRLPTGSAELRVPGSPVASRTGEWADR